MGLSDRDRAVLELERHRFRHLGVKETTVLDLFGWPLARYYQVLGRILDDPDAMAYDGQLVARLRRLRERSRRPARAHGFNLREDGR